MIHSVVILCIPICQQRFHQLSEITVIRIAKISKKGPEDTSSACCMDKNGERLSCERGEGDGFSAAIIENREPVKCILKFARLGNSETTLGNS